MPKHTFSLALSLILAAYLAGCNQNEDRRQPRSEPKTSYGQAVKKAKDLNQTAVDRDQEVRDQMEEMDKK
jgi:hypothetical protein